MRTVAVTVTVTAIDIACGSMIYGNIEDLFVPAVCTCICVSDRYILPINQSLDSFPGATPPLPPPPHPSPLPILAGPSLTPPLQSGANTQDSPASPRRRTSPTSSTADILLFHFILQGQRLSMPCKQWVSGYTHSQRRRGSISHLPSLPDFRFRFRVLGRCGMYVCTRNTHTASRASRASTAT